MRKQEDRKHQSQQVKGLEAKSGKKETNMLVNSARGIMKERGRKTLGKRVQKSIDIKLRIFKDSPVSARQVVMEVLQIF